MHLAGGICETFGFRYFHENPHCLPTIHPVPHALDTVTIVESWTTRPQAVRGMD